MKNYEIGEIVKGKITGVTSYGVFVKIDEDVCGLVHISEISDTYIDNISNYYEKGMMINVKIIGTNANSKKYNFSIKKIDCSSQSNLSKIPEVGEGFNLLESNLKQWVASKYYELNSNKK